MKLFRIFIILVAVFLSTVRVYADEIRNITFPVSGAAAFINDFRDPRGGGTREHLGIDIVAQQMTPIISASDGYVSYIAIPEQSWGYGIFIKDDEGYTYRYIHINNDTPGTDDGNGGVANAYASGTARGMRVTKGQHIAWVGDSGNAESIYSHLHFEIRDKNGTPINPYESLIAAASTSPHAALIKWGSNFSTTGVTGHDSNEGAISSSTVSTTTQSIASTTTANVAQPAVVATSTGAASFYFAKNLSKGATGLDVTELQKRLKAFGYFSGTPTGYFGTLTEQALIQFQKANNITPAFGYCGEITRSILNKVTAYVPIPTTQSPDKTFTKDLQFGMDSEDVTLLQEFLIAQKTGPASQALADSGVTTYFGNLTRSALIEFQKTKQINPASGYFGPLTRKVVNSTGI